MIKINFIVFLLHSLFTECRFKFRMKKKTLNVYYITFDKQLADIETTCWISKYYISYMF